MKKFIVPVLIVVMVVSIILAGCVPGAAPAPPVTPPPVTPEKTIKVGVLAALTGGGAAWGLPILQAAPIWEDEVRAAGGIQVGDERYQVEWFVFDDEFIPSKGILGVEKLYFEDKVNFIVTVGGGIPAAIAPFLNEHKLLNLTFCAYRTMPDCPYTLSLADNSALLDAMNMQYYADNYPEIQRVAFIVQDDDIGWATMAGCMATAESAGWDVVYNKFFSIETVDFAPLVSAVLAGDPDVICMGGIWSNFRVLIVEQAYLQGYKGYFEASEWDKAGTLAKVPAEYLNHSIGTFPDLDDPMLPDRANEYYAEWMSRYGPGAPEDVHRSFMVCDWEFYNNLRILQYGIEQAGSIDCTEVRDALLADDAVPHLLGDADGWFGDALFGANYALACPSTVTEWQDGEFVCMGTLPMRDFFERNKDLLAKYYTEYNSMWWQK